VVGSVPLPLSLALLALAGSEGEAFLLAGPSVCCRRALPLGTGIESSSAMLATRQHADAAEAEGSASQLQPGKVRPRPWESSESVVLDKKTIYWAFDKLCIAARKRDFALLNRVYRKLKRDPRMLSSPVPALAGSPSTLMERTRDALMRAQSRCGLIRAAEGTLDVILRSGRLPKPETTGCLMHEYCRKGRPADCEALLKRLSKLGFTVSTRAFNIYLVALMESNRYDDALSNLRESVDRWGCKADVISFNTVMRAPISSISSEAYALMLDMDIQPDDVTAYILITSAVRCGEFERALVLFDRVRCGDFHGLVPSDNTYSAGIMAYTKEGKLDTALSLLRGLKQPPTRAIHCIMGGLLKAGRAEEVLQMFGELFDVDLEGIRRDPSEPGHPGMRQRRQKPTLSAYNIALEAMHTVGENAAGRRLFKSMLSGGTDPDIYTIAALVKLQNTAEGVLSSMAMIRTYGLRPSRTMLLCILHALADQGDAAGVADILDHFDLLGVGAPCLHSLNILIAALTHVNQVGQPVPVGSSPALRYLDRHMTAPTLHRGEISKLLLHETGLGGARSIMVECMANQSLVPDHFTYATLLAGIARADDLLVTKVFGSLIAAVDASDPQGRAAVCEALLDESMSHGVEVSGPFFGALLCAFGGNVKAAQFFWQKRLLPILSQRKLAAFGTTEPASVMTSCYLALAYVAGRGHRPDFALSLVYAMRKVNQLEAEISLVSTCYFNAKTRSLEAAARSGEEKKVPWMQSRLEEVLTIECGSKEKETSFSRSWMDDLPVKSIRVRW
jgi:hypothetical protein